MSLIRYQPWGLMRSLQDDIDRLFESRLSADVHRRRPAGRARHGVIRGQTALEEAVDVVLE